MTLAQGGTVRCTDAPRRRGIDGATRSHRDDVATYLATFPRLSVDRGASLGIDSYGIAPFALR